MIKKLWETLLAFWDDHFSRISTGTLLFICIVSLLVALLFGSGNLFGSGRLIAFTVCWGAGFFFLLIIGKIKSGN
jgi:hypothetical protein